MIRSFVMAAALFAAGAALAADLGVKKPSAMPPPSAMCKETKALPPDAFGFATGSDVFDLGGYGIALDNTASAGLKGGRGYGYTGLLQLSGSFFPCLEVGPYVFVSVGGFKPYGGVDATGTIGGGGVELKYKLLGRAPHGVGLTFAVNPSLGGYNGRAFFGGNSSVFSNSFRLLADAELLKGRLYGALNLELFQTAFADTAPGFPNVSTFAVRGALTTPVTESVWLGGELSYQVQKTGMWVNGNFRAAAAYIGPTFFWSITDKLTLNGTYAYQFAGTDKSGPGRELGTQFLPFHLARLKLAYSF